jgi:autotransporter-associated beta strand protein
MAFGNIFGQFSPRALGKRFFKRFANTVKRRFLRQQVQRRFSRFEHLEDRSMMAVTATFSAGTLFVALDATSDAVQIIGNSNTQGGIQLQSATLAPNQQTTFSGVTDIVVSDVGANATGQSVTFSNSSASTRLSISGAINVLAGLENVTFSNTQTITAGSVNIAATTGATTTFNTTIASTTITTSGSQNYANPVTLLDEVALSAGGTGVSLTDVNLGANTLTITGPGAIIGAIAGSGGVTKLGSGTLTYSGTAANTYSGLTTVSNGELLFNKTNALATNGNISITAGTLRMLADGQTSASSSVTVSGGILNFNNTDQTVGTLTIIGGTVQSGIALGTGDITVAGSLVQSGGTFIATSDTLTVNGDWARTGGVFNPNGGTVVFGGVGLQAVRSNGTAFNDVFHAASGTLRLADNLTTVGTFTNSAGVFDINGLTATLNTFVLAGGAVSNSNTTGAGSVRSSNPFDVQAGTISAVLANGAGAAGLTKTTGGTVTLAGANTYTGPTSVNGGTLAINGSVTSNVTVNSPGTLSGTGTVNGNVGGNGIFSPGNAGAPPLVPASPGIMTITGNFVPTGTVEFEVNSPYVSAGSDHDQYVVNGSVNLDGATLAFVNNRDTTQPTNNRILTLIRNASAGSVIPSANPADGATVDVGTRKFQIFYNGGDGNDVVLDAVTPKVSVTVRTSSGTDFGTSSISELGTDTLIFTFARDIDTGNAPILFSVGGTATFATDYTVAGNPSAGFSFTPTSGRIEFPDGTLEVTVTVTPIRDSQVEPNETIILTVIPGSTYSVTDPAAATGTITDNSITGVKYNDLNQNGVRDSGEPGVARVTIFLDLNNDGKLSIVEPAAVTDNFGRFTFPNLPAGVYTLREIALPGSIQTQPGTPDGAYHVIVPEGPLANLNFGNDLSGANDFGDAPPSYGTTLAGDGARHGRIAGFRLGAQEDGEPDARLPLDGTGDDVNGVNDEDGVAIPVLTPGQGFGSAAAAMFTVTVSTGGNSPGRLSGWIDFNQNGRFDSTERVVANQLLSDGAYTINVRVPTDAKVGDTYARFRYGYETDLAPTGSSIAGEVEDYRVTIFPANPVAVDDMFPQPGDGPIRQSEPVELDVLENDIRTATSGVLHIIDVVSDPNIGTLQVQFNAMLGREVIVYTPSEAVVGDVQFTYRIQDESNPPRESDPLNPATVTVNVSLREEVAIDNTYTLAANDVDPVVATLDVMQNDLFALAANAEIDPGSIVELDPTQPTNMTVNADGTSLDFTAPAGFRGTAIYSYRITNDEGDISNVAFVTVQVVDNGLGAADADLQAAGYAGKLEIFLADELGNPIFDPMASISVDVNDTFTVFVFADDLRLPTGDETNRGFESAFLDMLMPLMRDDQDVNRDFFQVVSITPNPEFDPNGNGSFDESQFSTGLGDELGGFRLAGAGSTGLGPDPVEVFRVEFLAVRGTGGDAVQIVADPPDDVLNDITQKAEPPDLVPEVTFHEQPGPDQRFDVFFRQSGNITVFAPGEGEFVNRENPLDVTQDGLVSPVDAVTVVAAMQAGGSRNLFGRTPKAGQMIDTNMDSILSPIDAVNVVHYIQRHRGQASVVVATSSSAGGAGSSSTTSTGTDLTLFTPPASSTNSSSTASSTPMLLPTNTNSSTTSTSTGSTTSSTGSSSTSTSSTSSSSSTVDPEAADDYYTAMEQARADLKKFRR